MDVSRRPASSSRGRAAAVAGIALAVVSAASGCAVGSAGSDGLTTPTYVIEQLAYTATMKQSSADAAVTTSVSLSIDGHKIDETATESGPASWAADEADFKTTMNISGQARVTIRQIVEGNHDYSRVSSSVHLPSSLTSGIPGLSGWEETTWSGTSSDDPSQALSTFLFFGSSSLGNVIDPASLLALLQAQASSVRNLGRAVVDGVATTHYRALVPLSAFGSLSPAALKQTERVFGSNSIAFDYWIDSGGLLRQLSLSLNVDPARVPDDTPSSPGEVSLGITSPISVSTTLRLSDYGTPVNVVPPSPSQITSQVSCTSSSGGFSCDS
jgi:hypothetical protein